MQKQDQKKATNIEPLILVSFDNIVIPLTFSDDKNVDATYKLGTAALKRRHASVRRQWPFAGSAPTLRSSVENPVRSWRVTTGRFDQSIWRVTIRMDQCRASLWSTHARSPTPRRALPARRTCIPGSRSRAACTPPVSSPVSSPG